MTTGDVTYLVQELAGIHGTLKRLAAVAQQPAEPQSSIEIARNSRGACWTVKVYHPDPVEASTLAQGLYDQLAHRYGDQEGV
jgi:hypothetical protein